MDPKELRTIKSGKSIKVSQQKKAEAEILIKKEYKDKDITNEKFREKIQMCLNMDRGDCKHCEGNGQRSWHCYNHEKANNKVYKRKERQKISYDL